jgi:DNA-binding NtrC family response regulator
MASEPSFGPGRACGVYLNRCSDRRRGAAALVAAATAGLAVSREARVARERFEEELRALVQARSVLVRETPAAMLPPANALCLDVPMATPDARARIEAVFDPPHRLDEWTCQVLDTATHIAALLLELERAQSRWLPSARNRPDGAAPLIGSGAGIRAVRDRIERVAATDFTILIEGPSRR